MSTPSTPRPRARLQQSLHGFTLVELLVVVTIIVILLALLLPGMQKAIYQAELAVCGAQLRGVGSGAIMYTQDHRRSYPYRPAVQDPNIHDVRPMHLTYSPLWGQRGNHIPNGYDDRLTYRPYFGIKALQCPLSGKVDLESPKSSDTTVFASYPMWFGFQYRANNYVDPDTDATNPSVWITSSAVGRGMFKLGDRFEWAGETFNVLAGDLAGTVWLSVQASHPDSNGFLPLSTTDGEDSGTVGKVTTSLFIGGGSNQIGVFDPAYVRDDGSVERYPNVYYSAAKGYGFPKALQNDPRLSKVPSGTNIGDRGIVVPRSQ